MNLIPEILDLQGEFEKFVIKFMKILSLVLMNYVLQN